MENLVAHPLISAQVGNMLTVVRVGLLSCIYPQFAPDDRQWYLSMPPFFNVQNRFAKIGLEDEFDPLMEKLLSMGKLKVKEFLKLDSSLIDSLLDNSQLSTVGDASEGDTSDMAKMLELKPALYKMMLDLDVGLVKSLVR